MAFKPDDDGSIELLKFVDASAAIGAGMLIGLQLEYLQAGSGGQVVIVQLGMDTEQAQFLIDLLQTALLKAQQSPPDGTPRH